MGTLSEKTVLILDDLSFIILIFALGVGAVIILYALISGYIKHNKEQAAANN
jgi:NADH:ubiquinone oxidoreductase subunit 5 (subunit L)/multisubunit Na+/H+ antiporter MnhA subunit